MLDYNRFKEMFIKKLEEKQKTLFPDKQITYEIETAYSINEKTEFLILRIIGISESPSVSIKELYSHYISCGFRDTSIQGDIAKICQYVRMLLNSCSTDLCKDSFEPSITEDNITLFMINTEQNKDYLEDKPHREFLDLSIVYSVKNVYTDSFNMITVLNNKHMKALGLTEDDLYEIAYENTKRIYNPHIFPFTYLGVKSYDVFTYNVVDNYGAGSIIYADILKEYADEKKRNFYMIPSSVHEWLLLDDDKRSLEKLENLVWETNQNQVAQDERLSNNVYYYDKSTGEIAIVSNHGRTGLSDEYYRSFAM